MNPGTYFTWLILGLMALIGFWLIVELVVAVYELAHHDLDEDERE